MIDCQVIRDLLPLYADGVAGVESIALVEGHLAKCPGCSAYLQRMQAKLEEEEAGDIGSGKALKKQKHRRNRRTVFLTVAALLLGAAVCLVLLWCRGVFCIVDRQQSPDGAITTTVYSRDVTGPFPLSGGCTLQDQGAFAGNTVYRGAAFDGLWWSPNSKYQVISLREEDGIRLVLINYLSNSSGNLDAWISMAVYNSGLFPREPMDEMEWLDAEYRFIQWSEDGATMLIRYDYLDMDGVDQAGYFWYNCENGKLSGKMELESAVARGTVNEAWIQEDGAACYALEPDSQDGHGDGTQFEFSIHGATALRGLEEISKGDQVMVVYRPMAGQAHPFALSVTAK